MILLQRLGQVFIHLCLDAAFAVSHHGVRRKRDDGCPLGTEAAFILSNLGRSLKTTLFTSLATVEI